MELYVRSWEIKAQRHYLACRLTFLRFMGRGGGASPFDDWMVGDPSADGTRAFTSLRSPSKAAECDLFRRDEAISNCAMINSNRATPNATMPAWAAAGSEKNPSKPIVRCPILICCCGQNRLPKPLWVRQEQKLGRSANPGVHCAFLGLRRDMVDEILSGVPAK